MGLTFEGIPFHDVICHGSAMVDGYIPMLDSDVFVVLLDIRPVGNVACSQK